MKTSNELLSDYLDYCKFRKKLDPKTMKAYRIDLNQYLGFNSTEATFTERPFLEQYITQLHKLYKAKTIKRKTASISAFLNYLCYIEYISDNPLDKINLRFREEKLLPKTIPLHTLVRFFNTLYSEKESAKTNYKLHCCIRNIAVIELLFATGMRISELCHLKPSNIDFINKSVLIYGKGSKERIIQIEQDEVLDSLTLYSDTFKDNIAECGFFL